MSLRQCMRRHTERELKTWLAWLDMQWNTPERSDWYLMQVACEVKRVLMKNPQSVGVQDFRLKFKDTGARPASTRQAALASKMKWMGALGMAIPQE
jgi:ribosomal protein S19E (S16A)